MIDGLPNIPQVSQTHSWRIQVTSCVNPKVVPQMADVIILFLLLVASWFLFPIWVLSPFADACRDATEHGRKIYLVDIFALTLNIAMPMPLISVAFVSSMEVDAVSLVLIVVSILLWPFFYAWWRGVCGLSRMGVTSSLRRFVWLGVIFPSTIMITVGILILMFSGFAYRYLTDHHWFGGMALVGLLAIGGRALTKWVVSKPKRAENTSLKSVEEGTNSPFDA